MWVLGVSMDPAKPGEPTAAISAGLTRIHPPNARANSRVRAINIIRCFEVSSLGFKL